MDHQVQAQQDLVQIQRRDQQQINRSNAFAQEFAASGGNPAKLDNAADYWSPQGQDQGSFDKSLGPISPIPEYDGTECLKWDDSLWSHADHFSVDSRILCNLFT